ncbi:hypothetical protein V1289_002922 [Bradyrhizobium sp. AZCC 2289]
MNTERALRNVRHSSDLSLDNTRFVDHVLIRDCCILWILESVAPPFDRIPCLSVIRTRILARGECSSGHTLAIDRELAVTWIAPLRSLHAGPMLYGG